MDLMPLYQATAKGELLEALDADPDFVSVEAAEQAHADFVRAGQEGRPDIGYVAATTAAFIRMRLGQREAALSDRFDAAQALFLLADEPTAYDAARGEAMQVGALALEVQAFPLVFRCWVLAADCSWFGCDAAGIDRDRLVRALRDCSDALDWAGRLPDLGDQQRWLERLASLLGAVAGEGMSQVWPEDLVLETDSLLRRLSAGSDQLPVGLAFESTGGAAKAAQVAALLAELESRYGAL